MKSRRQRKKKKKKKNKVGENNGQLRFVRHHGWRTQARLDQNQLTRWPGSDSLSKVLEGQTKEDIDVYNVSTKKSEI